MAEQIVVLSFRNSKVKLKKVFVAADHAGFEYKEQMVQKLKVDYEVVDLGPFTNSSVDYPDFANLVASQLKSFPDSMGLLVCGSGQGMALRANKFPHIRAALVYSDETAKLAREHNDANVICLGSRFCTLDEALKWTNLFLNTPFAGGRHQTRVAKIGSDIS